MCFFALILLPFGANTSIFRSFYQEINPMKSIRWITLLFLLMGWAVSTQAQASTLYPGLSILQQNKQANKTNFIVKKWGITFKIQLTQAANAVAIRIHNANNFVLGQGVIQLVNGERKLTLSKSINGIVGLWHFSIDRIQINSNGLAVAKFMPGNTAAVDCQLCCYEEHLEAFGTSDGAYVEQQITAGKGPKDWGWYYELPPGDARQAYLGCVDSCLKGGECAQ